MSGYNPYGSYGAGPSGYDGGNKPKSSNPLSGVGDFLSRHGTEAATTALMYKCGGSFGKMMAAGQAADLAKKYQHEQKYSNPQPGYGSQQSGYGSQQSGYGSQQHGYYGNPQYDNGPQHGSGNKSAYGAQAKDLAGKAIVTGKELFGKAEKYAGKYMGSGGDARKQLQSGVIIQLVSQATGRPLQIVSAPDGRLVLDANGVESPQSFNAHFTVIREAEKVVLLHNNNNYVCIFGGQLVVHPSTAGPPPPNCRLRLHEPQPKCLSFESMVEQNACIGFEPTGFPKPPFSTKLNDRDALFSLRIVYAPVQY